MVGNPSGCMCFFAGLRVCTTNELKCIEFSQNGASRGSEKRKSGIATLPLKSKEGFTEMVATWENSVWKSQKKSHSNCERSELYLHFDWTKVHYKWQKWSIWATWSLRSNSVTRQVKTDDKNWLKMPKCQKFKCDILSHFQTMRAHVASVWLSLALLASLA